MEYYTLMVKWEGQDDFSPEFGSYYLGEVAEEEYDYKDRWDVRETRTVSHPDNVDPRTLME